MLVEYVPLIQVQRDLYSIPRGVARFEQYLRIMLTKDRSELDLAPLVMMNPMGKGHVTALLDALLALDADGVAARALADAAARLVDVPGHFKAGLVLADDAMGGWTNRYAAELDHRFGPERLRFRNRGRFWVTGVLWTSDRATEPGVREAIATAVYRVAYRHRHGPVSTLGDMLSQEGYAMAEAGCCAPHLDDEEIEYTRAVITPHLATTDHALVVACLFGDEAAASLGYRQLGLSPWAGLALALHDATSRQGVYPLRT